MDIIMDNGPRIEFDGNDIKVIEPEVEAEWGPSEVVVKHTVEGVIIDIVDMDSGEVVGTEAATWDEIIERIVN